MLIVGIVLAVAGLTLCFIRTGSTGLGLLFSSIGGFLIGTAIAQMAMNS